MADEGLLAKSGLDSIKVGGHKIPIALIAGVIALVGVIVVVRRRQQGQQVASVGQAPATAADTGFGLPLPGSDPGPALANISQQLNSLQQGLSTPASSSGWAGVLRGNVNPETGQSFSSTVNIPVFGSPGGASVGQLAESGSVQITGAPVIGPYAGGQTRAYYPIAGPGGTEYVLAQDVVNFNRV
jgi:hypothetical protein